MEDLSPIIIYICCFSHYFLVFLLHKAKLLIQLCINSFEPNEKVNMLKMIQLFTMYSFLQDRNSTKKIFRTRSWFTINTTTEWVLYTWKSLCLLYKIPACIITAKCFRVLPQWQKDDWHATCSGTNNICHLKS